jgi:transposase
VHITQGFSKDHRPDLKQLLFELTVTEDGAVPVWVGLHDGNVTDDRTHIGTWKALCQMVGGPKFTYVADSKLCVTETMTYITGQGGHFVTVLPATRKEERWFKEYLQTHTLAWQDVWRRPPVRRKDDPADIFRGVESPLRSAEGYRVLWYHSSVKHEIDQQARQVRIDRAVAELEFLKGRVGTRRLKSPEQVEAAAAKILLTTGAQRWVVLQVDPGEEVTFRQAGPGRPGEKTAYRQVRRPLPKLLWRPNNETIAYDSRTDGLFPLVTDLDKASLKQVLLWYKFQPRLEKRFEQLKTVLGVRPVSLKKVERVEAYCLLYFIALVVEALIERELRQAMRREGIRMLPLYPEKRLCKAPTAERALDLYAPIRRHRLFKHGKEVQRFRDQLSKLQRQVLKLLGVRTAAYNT